MPPSATDQQEYDGNVINNLHDMCEYFERKIADAENAKRMLLRQPWEILACARTHIADAMGAEIYSDGTISVHIWPESDCSRIYALIDAYEDLGLLQNELMDQLEG